ncbi:hypothetical protein, partial [Desulfocastanea catecholica]
MIKYHGENGAFQYFRKIKNFPKYIAPNRVVLDIYFYIPDNLGVRRTMDSPEVIQWNWQFLDLGMLALTVRPAWRKSFISWG